jgi:hypothetical protein
LRRWPSTRITFNFMKCPLCRTRLSHRGGGLEDLLVPLLALETEVHNKVRSPSPLPACLLSVLACSLPVCLSSARGRKLERSTPRSIPALTTSDLTPWHGQKETRARLSVPHLPPLPRHCTCPPPPGGGTLDLREGGPCGRGGVCGPGGPLLPRPSAQTLACAFFIAACVCVSIARDLLLLVLTESDVRAVWLRLCV